MVPPLPKEAVKILEKQFEIENYIRREELMGQLVQDTTLKAEQIRSWFARTRQNIKKAEEKQKLDQLTANEEKKNDDETRAKEGKIAELAARLKEKEVKIAELEDLLKANDAKIAKLEDLLKANDAESKSPKVSAGMKDDDETRAMWPEEIDADSRLELEQQTRERGKRKREEEKHEIAKKIAKQDPEIRRLGDQIAALQVQNAELQRRLEDLPSWGDMCTFVGTSD